MEEDNRRQHRRDIVNLPGHICGEVPQAEFNVINLSVQGALILCARELSTWDDLCLEVEFSPNRKLRLLASVCWAEAGLAGVKFIRLDAEAAAFLEWYMVSLRPVVACDVLG